MEICLLQPCFVEQHFVFFFFFLDGTSIKTLSLPDLHSFLNDALDCAFANRSLQEILEEFQLFCLLKAVIEMGHILVNQSLMVEVIRLCLLQVFGEFQVQF
jgi:hypothetical protein